MTGMMLANPILGAVILRRIRYLIENKIDFQHLRHKGK